MTADGFKPPGYYTPRSGPSPLVIGTIAGVAIVVVGVVLAFALKLGPFAAAPAASATPTVSTAPTVSNAPSTLQTGQPTTQPSPDSSNPSSQQPTADSTSGPTDTPTADPTLGPSPSDALGQLLAHVPEAIRPSCTPGTSAAPVTALVSCTSADGIAVDYALYEDIIGMHEDYDSLVGHAQIERDSGTCYEQNPDGTLAATSDSWPSERVYSIADEPIGRYLCEPSGLGSITWTDDRFDILSVANASVGDLDRLVTFWVNEAGPVL